MKYVNLFVAITKQANMKTYVLAREVFVEHFIASRNLWPRKICWYKSGEKKREKGKNMLQIMKRDCVHKLFWYQNGVDIEPSETRDSFEIEHYHFLENVQHISDCRAFLFSLFVHTFWYLGAIKFKPNKVQASFLYVPLKCFIYFIFFSFSFNSSFSDLFFSAQKHSEWKKKNGKVSQFVFFSCFSRTSSRFHFTYYDFDYTYRWHRHVLADFPLLIMTS